MRVTFCCPRCGKPVVVDGGQTGQPVACPYCAGACLIPPPVPGGTPPPDQFACNNPRCGSVWFADQLRREEFQEQPLQLCPACRWGVTRLVRAPSFWERVPDAFLYPWRGDGPWLIGLGALLLAFLELAARVAPGIGALFAVILNVGYFGMFGLDVIRVAAQDDDRPMDWPDLAGWADILAGALQVFGSGLLVFAPALTALIMAGRALFGGAELAVLTWGGAALGLTVIGVLYYPMAMLAVALFDTVKAVNPLVVIPAILRVPLHYGFVLLLLLVMGVVHHGAVRVLGLLPLGWQALGFLPVAMLGFYTLIVSCRLLGWLYRANARKLGWFT